MKTIIAGSRDITDYALLEQVIQESGFDITTVLCGLARGVDMLGNQYANRHRLGIMYFKADWSTYGKSAGYRRNVEMSNNAEACIILWDGISKGTKHMIDIAINKNLHLYVYNTRIAKGTIVSRIGA